MADNETPQTDAPVPAPTPTAPEGEVIRVPQAPRLNLAQGTDIVAAPEKKPASAVIGSVEVPLEARRGAGGRGGPGGGGGRGPGGGRGRGGPGGGRGRGGPGGNRGRRDDRGQTRREEEEDALFEKVVEINRCSKVVAGGRRFSFAALVVVGDQAGQVGIGYGKAKEVPEAIRKGTERARKNMEKVSLRNNTIPHPALGEHDGGKIMLRPATPGTGLIAGGGVRAVLEAAGVKDVLTKSLRSNNPGAMVFATRDALRQQRDAKTMRALRFGASA